MLVLCLFSIYVISYVTLSFVSIAVGCCQKTSIDTRDVEIDLAGSQPA